MFLELFRGVTFNAESNEHRLKVVKHGQVFFEVLEFKIWNLKLCVELGVTVHSFYLYF